uniref:ENY2 transcription and export complex 2 subunit n=1 Tax=Gadus morhua TaxID=8049 RepID=A0A8C5BEA7_GADMO
MSKDSQMRAAINQKLIEMGERERLKELLRAKLVECGWKDQLKAHCKGFVIMIFYILHFDIDFCLFAGVVLVEIKQFFKKKVV